MRSVQSQLSQKDNSNDSNSNNNKSVRMTKS